MTLAFEARIHHAVHFLKLAATASELYHKGGDDLVRAVQMIDSEWTNISDAQAWVCANLQEKEAAGLCSLFPEHCSYFLDLRLSPEDRIHWRKLGLAAARRLKDRRAEADHLFNLANAYCQVGRLSSARYCFKRAGVLYRNLKAALNQAEVTAGIASCHLRGGKPRLALRHYQRAWQIGRTSRNREFKINVMNNQGLAYLDLGEPYLAAKF